MYTKFVHRSSDRLGRDLMESLGILRLGEVTLMYPIEVTESPRSLVQCEIGVPAIRLDVDLAEATTQRA